MTQPLKIHLHSVRRRVVDRTMCGVACSYVKCRSEATHVTCRACLRRLVSLDIQRDVAPEMREFAREARTTMRDQMGESEVSP